MHYSNTSKSWEERGTEREFTAFGVGPRGTWNATAVHVPFTKLLPNEAGELVETTLFDYAGVRIEATELRSERGEYRLPGHVWFWSRHRGTVSETCPARFEMDRCGGMVLGDDRLPVVSQGHKYKGVPVAKHRLQRQLMDAVMHAEMAFEAHKAQ